MTGPLLLPAQRRYVVNPQHPRAGDHQVGTDQRPLRSIGAAAALAQPGDTVWVAGGTYRERIAPPRGGLPGQPIVYMAAPGAQVRVTATEPWQPQWVDHGGGVWAGSLATVDFRLKPPPPPELGPAPAVYNPFLDTLTAAVTGEPLSLGQVFVSGQPLQEVIAPVTLRQRPGSWRLNAARDSIWLHLPAGAGPIEVLDIELTTRRRCFAPYRRGLGYIEVIGFRFDGGATNFPESFWRETGNPQAGIVSTRAGHHWRIENCHIRYGKSIGLDIGNEGPRDADGLGQTRSLETGYHLIRANHIIGNGCGGIEGLGSTGTQIIGNRIEGNNRLGFTAAEIGGIKLHVFTGGLIADNIIRENYGYGLWLDNIWHNTRVTRNLIVANQGTGLFIELGEGPLLVDHNIIALNYNPLGLNADGVYAHDASGVTFAHNLVYGNANFGLWVHLATDRKVYEVIAGQEQETRILCQASDWQIYNNLIWGNYGGALALPANSPRSHSNHSDFNILAGPFDYLTSETTAAGLAPPLMRLLPNKGRLDADSLYATLLPPDDAPLSAHKPFISLAEWQNLGFDRHSRHSLIIRPTLLPASLLLTFMADTSWQAMGAYPLPALQTDFLGQPFGAAPIAGPFQNVVFLPPVDPKPVPHRGPYNHLKPGRYPMNQIYLEQRLRP